jgi:NADPH2:quinone reductase
MKAIIINKFGGPDVFAAADVEPPKPEPGQLLIRVEATSVNPVDTKIRSGALKAIAPPFPAILHGDVAGVVESTGEGVDGFNPGDPVYACPGGFKDLPGALAEFILADARLVARRPSNLDSRQSAALPLASITAWDALHDRGQVKEGMKVLVHGGCGGVGHLGLQLAKAAGAEVTTTVSTSQKADIALALGADHVVLYPEQEVDDYVQEYTGGIGFDLVFDTVGDANLQNSFAAIRLHGTVVSIAARSQQDLAPLHIRGGTLSVTFMLLPLITGKGRERHGEILREITRLVESGKVRPLLDESRFTIDGVGAAHARLETGQALGKVSLAWT